MNIEILFRGKTEKGGWIEGNLFIPNLLVNGAFICPTTTYVDMMPGFEDGDNIEDYKEYGCTLGHFQRVIPETVGQFTGLTDKNGKKIFEGDIIKNGLSGTWIIQPLENGSMSLLGICKKYKNSNYDISALNQNVEIIGNIHDNHEILTK